MDELASALVEQEWFSWERGMSDTENRLFTGDGWVTGAGGGAGEWESLEMADAGALPDLADPATAGCLLAMLAGSVAAYAVVSDGRLFTVSWGPDVDTWAGSCSAPTLGEAVARCLLALKPKPKRCGRCGSDIPTPGPCPVCEDSPFGRRQA